VRRGEMRTAIGLEFEVVTDRREGGAQEESRFEGCRTQTRHHKQLSTMAETNGSSARALGRNVLDGSGRAPPLRPANRPLSKRTLRTPLVNTFAS
jgi:hypothetical protein